VVVVRTLARPGRAGYGNRPAFAPSDAAHRAAATSGRMWRTRPRGAPRRGVTAAVAWRPERWPGFRRRSMTAAAAPFARRAGQQKRPRR
jgi:hypothetical protein